MAPVSKLKYMLNSAATGQMSAVSVSSQKPDTEH